MAQFHMKNFTSRLAQLSGEERDTIEWIFSSQLFDLIEEFRQAMMTDQERAEERERIENSQQFKEVSADLEAYLEQEVGVRKRSRAT